MSRTVKNKHIMREMLDDNCDLPKEDQQIVRVASSRGNNLHEVEDANGQTFLVSMPNKFRRNVWVKRGDFVIVDPIKEGDKVKAEISRILTTEHIKEFTKQGIWPKRFTKKREADENYDMFSTGNLNHKHLLHAHDESEEDSSGSDEQTSDEEEEKEEVK